MKVLQCINGGVDSLIMVLFLINLMLCYFKEKGVDFAI